MNLSSACLRWTAGAALIGAFAVAGCSSSSRTHSAASTSATPTSTGAPTRSTIVYPPARRVDQRDTFHGVTVADPYRWLEDPDSAESRAWIDAQNALTFGRLERIPQREGIESRLTDLWNYETFSTPFKEGGKYFWFRNSGLQNQSVLYVADSLTATPRVLLDPNTLSSDGTVSLGGVSVSHDGKRLAYSISDGGSDWRTWRVKEVASGKDIGEEVRWSKFSGASWTKDNKGFFYSRYDEPQQGEDLTGVNYFQKLYYHTVGTPQSDDTLVYHRPDHKDWGFGGQVTDDGAYLVIGVWRGTERKNAVFYKDLSYPESEVVELLPDFDAQYSFIDNDGPVFWFATDLDAPNSRVIAIDTRRPDRANWREIIAEQREPLQSAMATGERFICTYLKDVKTVVRVHDLDGRRRGDVDLPGIGSANGFGGKRNDPETFFSFTSFTTPTTIFRYDVSTGRSEIFRKPEVKFDPSQYTTEQVFYRSKDGTRIPMFISYKKGLRRNGENPTLLYGYGGFDISITPSFSVSNLAWMEMGGVYAVANIRGGGEYGKAWHEAGMKLTKQNCFDDFIAAAEDLISRRYTNSSRLAIAGGSNGGLLVGACITQRPELFGAAIPQVGVLDMLRFHLFTIGWAWQSDYGSIDNKDEFNALRAYSPYHNVRKGVCFPPTLVMTGDHDDRVAPAHSFKFAAALQEAQSCDNPVLIRIETRAGHGAGTPTQMLINQAADRWAFLVDTFDMQPN